MKKLSPNKHVIRPYPVGTRGVHQFNTGKDATFHLAVITRICDYTDWCDKLKSEEPMYEADVTTLNETVIGGLINHCRFTPYE